MLGQPARIPPLTVQATVSSAYAIPDHEGLSIYVVQLTITQGEPGTTDSETMLSSASPIHVILRGIITPEGSIIGDHAWALSKQALAITGLPAPSMQVPATSSTIYIPIIAPAGIPYVLDIAFGSPSGGYWLALRFVDFAQSPVLRNLVEMGIQQVGRPYVWGGVNDYGSNDARALWNGKRVQGFDCSGLVIYLYRQIAIEIPWRRTRGQWLHLPPVDVTDILPGDLVYWRNRRGKIYHVGIVMGDIGSGPENPEPDGEWDLLHAPSRNQTVRIEYSFFEGPMLGVAGFRTLIGYNEFRGY